MAETALAKSLREYETIFLVKPDLTDDQVDKLKDRVRGIVDREGGRVPRCQRASRAPGSQRLPVRHRRRAA